MIFLYLFDHAFGTFPVLCSVLFRNSVGTYQYVLLINFPYMFPTYMMILFLFLRAKSHLKDSKKPLYSLSIPYVVYCSVLFPTVPVDNRLNAFNWKIL